MMPEPSTLEGGRDMGSYVPFSSVPRCSRPKAPRLDDMDPSSTSPHHWRHARRKPRSTQNNKEQGTSPHLSTPALATTMMHATSSMHARGIGKMELAMVTTLDGAAATIAGRTGAHCLNPRDHGSLAKTSATRYSQRSSGNLPTSPSTRGNKP
jgi:hypothetical protein